MDGTRTGLVGIAPRRSEPTAFGRPVVGGGEVRVDAVGWDVDRVGVLRADTLRGGGTIVCRRAIRCQGLFVPRG